MDTTSCRRAPTATWGTTTTSSSRRTGAGRGGFTLYEVIIVLVVLMVVGGIVAPSFSGFLPSVRVRKAGDGLIATLEKARVDAALTSRRFRIVFTKEPPAYRLEYEPDPMNEPGTFRRLPGDWGARTDLPEGVSVSLTGAEDAETAVTEDDGEEAIEFSPDGSAAGVTILLAHENGRSVTIQLDPSNGRARVVEPEEDSP